MGLSSKILKILFFLCLAVFLCTYYAKNNYRNVHDLMEGALAQPIQTETADKTPVVFSDADYKYTLFPLYDYDITAMVVHKMDYTKFSIHRTDSVFPMDLCMLWGDNLKNGYYADPNLEFSQDFRFCLYYRQAGANFNANEMSNNHLIIKGSRLKKLIKNITLGDQVRIRGQLVNVEAENLASGDPYNPERIAWNSSQGRNDTGAGACEVIYAKDFTILKKSNYNAYILNRFGAYGLTATGLAFLVLLFSVPIGASRRNPQG